MAEDKKPQTSQYKLDVERLGQDKPLLALNNVNPANYIRENTKPDADKSGKKVIKNEEASLEVLEGRIRDEVLSPDELFEIEELIADKKEDKDKKPFEGGRKKAPGKFKPKDLDEAKEGDIIAFMYEKWYVAGLNKGMSIGVGLLEIGVFRTFQMLENSAEERRRTTVLDRSNTPHGWFASNMNQFVAEEEAEAQKLVAGTPEELNQKADSFISAVEKPENERTEEDKKLLASIPQDFLIHLEKTIAKPQKNGDPQTQDQKRYITKSMLNNVALMNVSILNTAAAKAIKKYGKGDKKYEKLDFVNNPTEVKKMIAEEGAIIRLAILNQIKENPSMIHPKENELSGIEKLSRIAIKAFHDEKEIAAGGSKLFRTNFSKFYDRLDFDPGDLDYEVKYDNSATITNAKGEHIKLVDESAPKLQSEQRRKRLKLARELVLKSKNNNFSVEKFIENNRDRL